MNLRELLPDEDYRLSMGFQRGDAARYFARTEQHEEIVAERARWLHEAPSRYAALLPGGAPLLEEFTALVSTWKPEQTQTGCSPWEQCLALGRTFEPDFLLLQPDAAGAFRLLGACVCFPSAWSLEEKMGRPMDFIHSVVPGLNEQLGKSIQRFLDRIPPGVASLRNNWGLSRSAERNLHPSRTLPRLDAAVTTEEVWLRVEEQALVALPRNGGVLFGIRIVLHSLAELRRDEAAARGLHRALATMPEALAAYKGLASARETLLRLLETPSPSEARG